MRYNSTQPGKVIAKKDVQKKGTFPQNLGPVIINYPLLWLALAAFVIYVPTFSFGFTELDDSIFIREFHAYNEDLKNLAVSFQRGLFDVTKDPYYRPLFMDSIIVNYIFAKQEIFGYHVVNVLLHVASVVMLYNVFVRLRIRKLHSFIITLIFAVHPVLTQAVAWIPGRNDSLLAVFSFSFFFFAIDYSDFGRIRDLLLSMLFLLLAYFTKETAVLVPVVAFILFTLVINGRAFTRNNIILYGSWIACFAIWYVARSQSANIKAGSNPTIGIMVTDFMHRLPLIPQYLGKILFPTNLSVFPMQEDTSTIMGIVAIIAIGASLYFSKDVNWRVVTGGALVFLLLLIPALLVPNNLNEQTFEHRLYLPIIGILILLTETTIFKSVIDSNTLLYSMIICVLLAAGNFVHQRNFKDPITFWTQAVETSPHSAYAKMMLGAREDNLAHSYELFRSAYKLDPKQKYLNYYYGKMLQMQDSVLESEMYLLKEKGNTGFAECDFYLARVAMTRADTMGAITYLRDYLENVPDSEPANNNLLRLYYDKRQIPQAKTQMALMLRRGMKVPADFVQLLNSIQ